MSENYGYALNALTLALAKQGFPKEYADVLAKNLGSPKAILRLTSYVNQVKPRHAEDIADEMLAIMEDIAAWRNKKESEAANAAYNEYLQSKRGF